MRAYDAADTDVNWRLPDGYGSLVARAAANLPILCDTPVTRIDRTGRRLRLDTLKGRLEAEAVIVAVPTTILAGERLAFDPPLPEKAEAAARLPLGLANKLFFQLGDDEPLPPDRHLIGNPHRAETGSYYLRPFGRPVIEAFFGGDHARALEAAGPHAMADYAAAELVDLFGSAFARRLRPIAASAWSREPFVQGAYSHALPGQAAARQALAAPVETRLFFAGEACSREDFSTAHGARATGEAAAADALAALEVLAPAG